MSFGATIERRREGGVKPSFDLGGNKDEQLKVRGLTVLSMSTAQHKVYAGHSLVEADERVEALQAQARASGGEYTSRAR